MARSDMPELVAHLKAGRKLEIDVGNLTLRQVHHCIDVLERECGAQLTRQGRIKATAFSVVVWIESARRAREQRHGRFI